MGNTPHVLAANKIPEVVLGSSIGSRSMPMLGFGTAMDKLKPHVLKATVLEAIKLGYRHFDTIGFYVRVVTDSERSHPRST
ncbi:NAD(P)H-dependent 6'-deoxychalcone synthase-like [Pyrus ussuriensis x Pyrus communis]|uniref:NAD(P)H-dependent 6'-deoxychalcone synthase-like n=1 Tax=Pyrus ussuriensis x Pyrus communis TaxID=2448454 RepID=A0A5N5I4F6_9ROSA|nr:NAD(P)H-dependent 6'-deoxychalcone synthase-like [Pyrus ussuriensis x Pyrus communis]